MTDAVDASAADWRDAVAAVQRDKDAAEGRDDPTPEPEINSDAETEEPEATTDDSEPGGDAPDGEKPQEKSAQEEDPLSGLPEPTRKYIREMEHRLRSESGRQRSYQQQIADLKRELETERTERLKAKQPEMPEEWAAFVAANPDHAKAIEAMFQHQQRQFQDIAAQQASQREQQELQREQAGFFDSVEAFWPNWQSETNTADFADWMERQARENAQVWTDYNTTSVAAARRVQSAWESHRQSLEAEAQKREQATSLSNRRKARLADSVQSPGKPSGREPDDPGDPDAMWAAAVKRATERHRGLR